MRNDRVSDVTCLQETTDFGYIYQYPAFITFKLFYVIEVRFYQAMFLYVDVIFMFVWR